MSNWHPNYPGSPLLPQHHFEQGKQQPPPMDYHRHQLPSQPDPRFDTNYSKNSDRTVGNYYESAASARGAHGQQQQPSSAPFQNTDDSQQQGFGAVVRHVQALYPQAPQPHGHYHDQSYASAPPPPHLHGQPHVPPPPPQKPHRYSNTQLPPQLQSSPGPPALHRPPPSPGHERQPVTITTHPNKKRETSPRASVACDSCRVLKAKCDENKPCRTCKDKNITCTYRETAPKVLSETAGQTVAPRHPTALDLSAGPLSWPTISKRIQCLPGADGIRFPREYPTLHEQHGNPCWHGHYEGTIGPSSIKDNPFQPNGDLDLHPETVWEYVKSYEMNIQTMYPLIIPKELHAMVTMVLKTASGASTTKTGRAWSQAASLERPQSQTARKRLKQRHESEESSRDGASSAPSELRLGQPSCSIESALILMVLALGKICLHWRFCTPAISSTSVWVGSGADAKETRDFDENIGRDYFVAAFEIFGAIQGDYKLEHVWVCILGSLYYDQLVRPIQSLELVTFAGRYLQDIIRPDQERYRKMRADVEQRYDSRDTATRVADNRKLVAAWTCMLIERADLDVLQQPPSNMLSFEQQLPYPNGDEWVAQGFDHNVVQAFASQIHLYILSNQVCSSLCDDRRQGQDKYPIIKACTAVLQTHASPNPAFQYSPLMNHDLPATDILTARLRATYCRVQVTVHLSFIQRILAFNHKKRTRKEMVEEAFKDDTERLDELAEEVEAVTVLTVELAKRGIRALVQSTRAFHDLPDQRFVITNVFGTMHAQWCNLLILDSVQRDPILGGFIDNDTLNDLFLKTIASWGPVVESSRSLSWDLHILRVLYQLRIASVLQEQ